jgi:hypothetical protein
MNYSPRKVIFWMIAFCLMFTIAISPALAKAQAGSTPTAQAAPASGNATAPATTTKASAPSAQEIAAAKSSGKVWVNTETRVYHKSGRWYGKTKNGKFMTEAEAKAAGYKAAQKE